MNDHVRVISDLNEDTLRVLYAKIVQLETDELEQLLKADFIRGYLLKPGRTYWDHNLNLVINHVAAIYDLSSLHIGWLHDAMSLYKLHWQVASKFKEILLQRWCEGCGKRYQTLSLTPDEVEGFLAQNWKCDQDCVCEEYFSGLNWCVDCRYGTHDFIETDGE